MDDCRREGTRVRFRGGVRGVERCQETLGQLLEVMTDPVARSLANTPVETEPVPAKEAAALDEAHAAIARGEGIPHEEILCELGSAHKR